MKITIRCFILSILFAFFVPKTHLYAVMFPQEVEEQIRKEKAEQKENTWQELEDRHSEILKTISDLERKEKDYVNAFEKVKKEIPVKES